MSTAFRVDAPPVTEREAVKLMAYHLALAAMYFEATPIDIAAVTGACTRYMHHTTSLTPSPAVVAMRAWLRAIDAYYKKLDE